MVGWGGGKVCLDFVKSLIVGDGSFVYLMKMRCDVEPTLFIFFSDGGI